MSGFLARVVDRALGVARVARPRREPYETANRAPGAFFAGTGGTRPFTATSEWNSAQDVLHERSVGGQRAEFSAWPFEGRSGGGHVSESRDSSDERARGFEDGLGRDAREIGFASHDAFRDTNSRSAPEARNSHAYRIRQRLEERAFSSREPAVQAAFVRDDVRAGAGDELFDADLERERNEAREAALADHRSAIAATAGRPEFGERTASPEFDGPAQRGALEHESVRELTGLPGGAANERRGAIDEVAPNQKGGANEHGGANGTAAAYRDAAANSGAQTNAGADADGSHALPARAASARDASAPADFAHADAAHGDRIADDNLTINVSIGRIDLARPAPAPAPPPVRPSAPRRSLSDYLSERRKVCGR